MRYIFPIIFIIFLVFPAVSALELEIEKESTDFIVIEGLPQPVIVNLIITNHGSDESLEFYNLLGFRMDPKGPIQIESGKTKEIALTIHPRIELMQHGFYIFRFFIRGQRGDLSEEIIFRKITLDEAFSLETIEIGPEARNVSVYLNNNVDFNFENIDLKFESLFFEKEENISLEPYEKKEFFVDLDRSKFGEVLAGYYTLRVEANIDEKKALIEGTIVFSEEDLLSVKETEYGFFINTKKIEKINEGNVVARSSTVIEKNIISRLFTSFNPEPDIVDRERFSVYYTWDDRISPGDSVTISVKTNWIFPLLIIFFLVIIIFIVKKYSVSDLVLRKKISFVKAKGGEFALKVTIIATACNFVEKVNVMDRLPNFVKLYEKFGHESPKRIDQKGKRIEWGFERLEAGEKRVMSYVIYSKIGVLGKFALPTATAVYEREGRIHETESNKVYFATEQKKEEENLE